MPAIATAANSDIKVLSTSQLLRQRTIKRQEHAPAHPHNGHHPRRSSDLRRR
jgi:hypothetical protein